MANEDKTVPLDDPGFVKSQEDREEIQKMKSVNRFEVIDDTGRAYTKYLKDEEGIKYSLQDDDRTLKVFIDNKTWKDDL
jgi:hypothetical protein